MPCYLTSSWVLLAVKKHLVFCTFASKRCIIIMLLADNFHFQIFYTENFFYKLLCAAQWNNELDKYAALFGSHKFWKLDLLSFYSLKIVNQKRVWDLKNHRYANKWEICLLSTIGCQSHLPKSCLKIHDWEGFVLSRQKGTVWWEFL